MTFELQPLLVSIGHKTTESLPCETHRLSRTGHFAIKALYPSGHLKSSQPFIEDMLNSVTINVVVNLLDRCNLHSMKVFEEFDVLLGDALRFFYLSQNQSPNLSTKGAKICCVADQSTSTTTQSCPFIHSEKFATKFVAVFSRYSSI